MSDELTDKQQAADEASAPKQDASTSSEELSQLMGSGETAAPDAEQRLEDNAMAAAEAAIQRAEKSLADAGRSFEESARPAPRKQISKSRLWALRAVLLVNFALMGVMIALPSQAPKTATTTETEAATDPVVDPIPDPPFVEPLRDPRLMLPADKKYDEALIAGRDGDYELAARLMHDYIRAHPNLDPSLKHGAYVTMARYLHLSGRTEEAVEYETLARRMVGSSHLPADLWRTARAAEERGDMRGMRRAYARLLLQQNMLTPSQLAVVTEAYLKFGESYRLEAVGGEEDARTAESERLRQLRDANARGDGR